VEHESGVQGLLIVMSASDVLTENALNIDNRGKRPIARHMGKSLSR
jgi:hypothetical protein